ncbi:Rho-GTPase-activating protein 5 [Exophiala dermatitidis]
MATGGAGASTTTSPEPVVQSLPRNSPAPPPTSAPLASSSPPSKRELASWWRKFRKTTEKTDEKADVGPGIFGVPLADSIRYANVAISLQNENGESFIYGYVPIVVAKCGVFLKEKATDVEGIFRLSGSAKRIKDLQTVFNSPDRYGKGLDWTGYTVHDAANILRRYLNQLPEPIIPLEFYERFREPLRPSHTVIGPDGEAQPRDLTMEEHAAAVRAYQKLITELPPLNRQLLLYILDLLAVFASKSDYNRMPAANLAAIFQPGIISHPSHDMSPMEYKLSQDVLVFLIENQDNFLIGMSGTAVDEKTQKDVESGPPSLRSPKIMGRSASNASAGAESLRKFGVRRNVSVSSRGSRTGGSPGVSGPGTPPGAFAGASATGGLARSNTVPSKRSPAINSGRFQRFNDASESALPAISSPIAGPGTPTPNREGTESKSSRSTSTAPDEVNGTSSTLPANAARKNVLISSQTTQPPSQPSQHQSQPFPNAPLAEHETSQGQGQGQTPAPVPTRERKISTRLHKSPIFGPSESQGRQPRKLQKRQKIPGGSNDSAQSSLNSLHAEDQGGFHTPLMSPDINSASKPDPLGAQQGPSVTNIGATPVEETPGFKQYSTPGHGHEGQNHFAGLKPPTSPPGSTRSRSSFTDHSEAELADENQAQSEQEKRRRRWRFSSSAKKGENSPLAPPPPIGQNVGARGSNTSLGSSHRPRKSFTGDSQDTSVTSGQHPLAGQSSQESGEPPRDQAVETEKKGLFGKWKAKMAQTREERQAEKERARSPPASGSEQGGSRSSLTAFAQENLAQRGRSFDKSRDEVLSSVAERPADETQVPDGPLLAEPGQSEEPGT